MTKAWSGSTAAEESLLRPETNWMQVEQRHYDPGSDEDLTSAIVFALADAMDVVPREVRSPTLYECLDVSSLEKVFFGLRSGTETETGRLAGRVEFGYGDYLVRVESDGWVRVYEPRDDVST